MKGSLVPAVPMGFFEPAGTRGCRSAEMVAVSRLPLDPEEVQFVTDLITAILVETKNGRIFRVNRHWAIENGLIQ